MIEVNVSPTIISLTDGDNVIEITAGTVIGVAGSGGDLTPVYDAIAEVDAKADEALALGATNSTAIELKADKTQLQPISDVADQALSTANDALTLAQTNQLNIGNKADKIDLDATNENVAANTLSIESKVSQVDFDALELVVDEKITLADAQGLIDDLVGNAPAALDTIYEIAAQLQADESAISGLMTAVGNRVRYDAAQSLTTPQQDQARANIVAEKVGVAAGLIATITPASIGAATAAQGLKANTALQSADVAPVALSGAFSALTGVNAPLTNINAITGTDNDIIQKISGTWVSRSMAQLKTALGFSAEVLATTLTGFSASNLVVTAADTALSAWGKLQGQISALATVARTGVYSDLTGKPDLTLKADLRLTTNTQSASYTAALIDSGKEVIMDVASANNFTIPPSSSVAWTTGDQLTVFQRGAGQTTIIAGSGVTINNRHATLKLIGQYSTVYLRYRGSDLWAITGELSET